MSESEAAAILQAWQDGGEPSAVAELRRFFPLIGGDEDARRCVRAVVGWAPPAGPEPGAER